MIVGTGPAAVLPLAEQRFATKPRLDVGGFVLTDDDTYYRILTFAHYSKRARNEIPEGHPLARYAVTGAGLKPATGGQLPDDAFTIRYPELDPAWDFDFGDHGEMTRRLPRLAALHLE
ncbi:MULTISPECIES: hypothetical protein [Streptomyces]|uniref:Uncharacterized protein n=1 Tax=Streptomyces edwardsiae TaxID=3075527 RepID=A0ABU2QLB0_9ACTN|nr:MULTISPECIES: hypothetical protein [unclassified Streptomyces]MDT0405251.1 hypothetical protein [Streptomyces sp. DSM 41635]